MSNSQYIEDSHHFFEVHTEDFHGPIDLLLHLVKQRELEIEKLSLAEVADQYLETIERLRKFDLEIAAEYLVIAATLISIKSSYLLNEPVELIPDEDGNLIDPHELLLDRLREAAIYKEGAKTFSELSMLGIDVFASPPKLKEVPKPPVEFAPHDAFLLGKAFKKLLDRAGDERQMLAISMESVSIVDTMMGILKRLDTADKPLPFEKLVTDVTSRSSLIAGLIALLELCKRGAIQVKQDESFAEILIAKRGSGVDLESLSSEFDESSEEEAKEGEEPEVAETVNG